MRFKKITLSLLLCMMIIVPNIGFSISAASAYTNDFSDSSLKDFDTTTANALVVDGALQLKKGDGDSGVVLKTQQYENFTLEVDVTVNDFNDGGAPFIMYHTQQPNNPFQGGTYTAVLYQTDVKGCFFAPYHDNGWVRNLNIYQGNQKFRIKVEVYNNYASFYVGDKLLGSFDSGSEFQKGYIGLGSFRAAVTYDNLKITPSAPKPGNTFAKGKEILKDDFSGNLSKMWVTKTKSEVSVSNGKLSIASPDRNDRYAMYSQNITDSKYIVEATVNFSGGNSGLLVKGGYDDNNNYSGYSFTYDKENNLMKASRYFNGYLSVVENIRVAPLSGEHTMTVYVDGSRHSMYVDDKLILEFVDSTFKDGYAGCMAYNTTSTFDNLKVYSAKGNETTKAPTKTNTPTSTSADTTSPETTSETSDETTAQPTVSDTTTSPSETTDQPKDSPSFLLPLIILGVLVVLGAGGFVVYKKFVKKSA